MLQFCAGGYVANSYYQAAGRVLFTKVKVNPEGLMKITFWMSGRSFWKE